MNYKILMATAMFGLGLVIGVLWARTQVPLQSSFAPEDVHVNSDEYEFINPLLFSRTKKDLYSAEYKILHDSVANQVLAFEKKGDAADVSVYFRDLNTGHWTGIDENKKYDPSSLLKVVTMITYLRKTLSDPTILNKQLYYEGPNETGQHYKSSEKLAPGYHSILQLMKAMIIDSDNTSKKALTDYDPKAFEETYKDFRLPLPATTDTNDYMSARSYSVVFRALYNSTYLPWTVSEQTLSLLSLTNFDRGIVAGVPKGTTVSHKFGEHTYVRADGTIDTRELHDCGIVYHPAKPYLLCIMTRGKDFLTLESVLSGISKNIYTYVQNVTEK